MTFFILLTTAATLHRNGIFIIDTPQQAASGPPAAGRQPGVLAVLVRHHRDRPAIDSGPGRFRRICRRGRSGDRGGFGERFSKARGFYSILALATIVGFLLGLLGINTIKALYFAAIVNGGGGRALIFIIIRMAGDRRIVKGYRTSVTQTIVGWLTFAFMATAVVLMVASLMKFKF